MMAGLEEEEEQGREGGDGGEEELEGEVMLYVFILKMTYYDNSLFMRGTGMNTEATTKT